MKKLPLFLYKSVYAAFWTSLLSLLLFLTLWLGLSSFQRRFPKIDSPAELYSTETLDDLEHIYKQAIDRAKNRILLIIYALNDNQLIQALRKKASEGVDVQVICDINASSDVPKKLGSQVKVLLRKPKKLMHQKILCIDDKQVWVGSANMTTTSLKVHGNLILGLESPPLALWIAEKFEAMKRNSLPKTSSEAFNTGKQKLEMWFLPDNPQGVEKIRSLIQSAKKSIRVAMYTWTRKDFADAIIEANKRGVKTHILLDKESTLHTNLNIAKLLSNAGISVRTNQGPGLLHHKLLIIDDKILINGSANWTYPAFSQNDDCFTVIDDLNDKQIEFLNKMWERILLNSRVWRPV